MLDKRMEMMLQVAAQLTADDLDTLRTLAPAIDGSVVVELSGAKELDRSSLSEESVVPEDTEPFDGGTAAMPTDSETRPSRNLVSASTAPRGEYERQRTRESKVSTECLGHERERHDWWPVGTQLVGRIGSETFTALVVANPQVKSGRSIRVTSSPTAGMVCLTPTRAAIEATEDYRQAHNLGRGGGVTNGWSFWKPA